MRLIKLIITFFICQTSCFGMENVFYVMRDNKNEAIKEITEHKQYVDIVILQSLVIDAKGNVSGGLDQEFLTLAKMNAIKWMPMVTNSNFDSKLTHEFLSNQEAQNKALISIVETCKKNNCFGVQFDFEMMPLTDRQLLTNFYQLASDVLHKNNFVVSFTVAPTLTNNAFSTEYQKKLYKVWQGVYDVKKLGEISDFITIMAYDQHGIGTIPGPIAGLPWVERVLHHALTLVPANKISLGVPTYSGFWYMTLNTRTNRTNLHYDSLSYSMLQYIIKKFHPPVWQDNTSKINFSFYESGGLNKYIFVENAFSFKTKYELAEKYQLRGISVFRLGIEDPKIWDVLTDQHS